jgi:predicted nucleotidyltransferase
MTEKIQKYLEQLEIEKEIKILLACETGSRAWGFPSPDSDYDIRIIYVHKLDWYLTINESKDSIDVMLENNDLDISGWELRKSLRLLSKSNAPLFERIQSPIVYKTDIEFVEQITELSQLCYSKIATMHHYLSMSKKMLEDIQGKPEYKLKKFFYALRTASACLWILEKEEMPPIEFSIILNSLDEMNPLKSRINELIKIKSKASESYLHSGEVEIINFIKEILERSDAIAKSLPSSKGNIATLNSFFSNQIKVHGN